MVGVGDTLTMADHTIMVAGLTTVITGN
jgi:hypothetical protein